MSTHSSSVLVTGASTGIGEACALRLHGLGYHVFAGVRKPEDGERLRGQVPNGLHPLILDVTDEAQVRAAAGEVDGIVGTRGLAGLVNNAGVAVGGPLEFVSQGDFRTQFEVNVFGLLAVTQAFLPAIRRAKGRVVNIGSIAGRATTPLAGPYCASKHAVEALTDALRLELGPDGIQVSVIEPGVVRTPIWDKGIETFRRANQRLPAAALERYGVRLAVLGRLLAANRTRGVAVDAVADAVVHALASGRPRTRYVVGFDAKLRAIFRRFLPDRVNDAIILSFLRRLEQRAA